MKGFFKKAAALLMAGLMAGICRRGRGCCTGESGTERCLHAELRIPVVCSYRNG